MDAQLYIARSRHFLDDYTCEKIAPEYISFIKDCLRGVIHGWVKEIRWSVGNIELQFQLFLKQKSGSWEWIYTSGCPFYSKLYRFLARKHIITETEIIYESYYEQNTAGM